jgi:hypothetical protein
MSTPYVKGPAETTKKRPFGQGLLKMLPNQKPRLRGVFWFS